MVNEFLDTSKQSNVVYEKEIKDTLRLIFWKEWHLKKLLCMIFIERMSLKFKLGINFKRNLKFYLQEGNTSEISQS